MKLLLIFPLFCSLALGNYPIQQSVLLDAGANSITVANSGAAGGSYPWYLLPGTGHRVRVTVTPIDVPPLSGTAYSSCSNPCTVTMDLQQGASSTYQAYLWSENVDSSGNPLSPRQVSARVNLPMMVPACAPSWTLPIEVIGPDQFQQCVQVTNSTGVTTGLVAHFRVTGHGYVVPGIGKPSVTGTGAAATYDGKISIKVNNGSYIDLNCSNVTEIDENKFFGPNATNTLPGSCTMGNNYGPGAIDVTVPIPDSLVNISTNNVWFRFNGTDGNTSGFRVLDFNFLQSSVACSTFSVASNIVTATCNSHGWTTGEWVYFYQAPGSMYSMINGARQVIRVDANNVTFAACGGTANTVLSGACTSANGAYVAPTSQLPSYPSATQPQAYGARQLIAESTYTWDDPATWTAPGGGNATSGLSLWTTANLVLPNSPYLGYVTTYHCTTCHDTLGRDLKYFNYSNLSIEQRSLWHGLSLQNALDIAAYIRGITNSNAAPGPVCRPWNPVYQAGPGLDSNSLVSWACGAGIDAQLVYDADLRAYLAPGSFANTLPAGDVIGRQLPMLWQTPTWNQLLPPTPFGDFMPSTNFFSSALWTNWTGARDGITPNSFSSWQSYDSFASTFLDFDLLGTSYLNSFIASAPNPGAVNAPGFNPPSGFTVAENSVNQWYMVKQFELFHFYGLEGMAGEYQVAAHPGGCYNSTPYAARGWMQTTFWFQFGQHFNTAIPSQNTIPNRSFATWNYQTNAQYVGSVGINNGNRWLGDHSPIDLGYLGGFLTGVGNFRPDAWETQLNWIIGLQGQWCHPLPSNDNSGLNMNSVAPNNMINKGKAYPYLFSSAANITEMETQYATAIVAMINNWTTGQWQTWEGLNSDTGSCTSDAGTSTPANYGGTFQGRYCDQFAYALPLLKYWGISSTLYNSIEAWAAAIWSGNVVDNGGGLGGNPVNWSNQLNAVCLPNVDSNGTSWPVCSNAANQTIHVSIGSGAQTINMGFPLVGVGALLTVVDAGQENITVTSADGAGHITATFANAHTAPFRVVGAL